MAEALVCGYVRTPIGRYGGALSSVRPDDLAAAAIRELLGRSPGLDRGRIDEVAFGCANQAGEDNRNVARMASLLAGLPESVPAVTVNRLCASGMDAVLLAARMIKSGEAGLVVAGGVESMSRAPFAMPKGESAFSRKAEVYDTTIGWRFVNPALKEQYGIDSMPETAENVAERFKVSRADQDAFALRSQRRTAAAKAAGRFAEETFPVEVPQRRGDPVAVTDDEHPRPDTDAEGLAALPAPFRKGGSVTAGNSSGINDGAAALLLASEAAAKEHGLEPVARVIGGAAAGVEPALMGIGPIHSTRRLCAMLDMKVADFGLVELNEAFASQALAVLRELGIDDDAEHVNPNGGAISLGHPLGMSGARLIGTAALEMRRRGADLALATMCVGVGQGVSAALGAP